jgi:exodeoxyribonuclease-3
LQHANPDIICLQEIKATEDQIPVEDITKADIPTNIIIQQPKGYSGAIFV